MQLSRCSTSVVLVCALIVGMCMRTVPKESETLFTIFFTVCARLSSVVSCYLVSQSVVLVRWLSP